MFVGGLFRSPEGVELQYPTKKMDRWLWVLGVEVLGLLQADSSPSRRLQTMNSMTSQPGDARTAFEALQALPSSVYRGPFLGLLP